MLTADLHIHTTASDGRLSPVAIIEEAIRAKLSYIAITDHDTVDGLLQLKESNTPIPSTLKLIPGIEFSTDLPENDVHILGYHIDIYNPELSRQLDILVTHRHQRAKEIIDKLQQLGYRITYERVLELAVHATAIGRPHIAKALVEKGFFSTITDVFTTLLDKNGPAYVPHYKLTPKQVIDLVKLVGGIPVLAHPGLIRNDDIVLDVIHSGICGLEVYHPTHNEEQIEKYLTLANQHHLMVTGGSDFHAIPTRFPKSLGMFTVPEVLASQLEKPVVKPMHP